MTARDLMAFLTARVNDDERAVDRAIAGAVMDGTITVMEAESWSWVISERAAVNAKRTMIALYSGRTGGNDSHARGWHEATHAMLLALASEYANHPDYRKEWALS